MHLVASGERELFFFGDVIPGKLSMSVQAVLMELVGGGGSGRGKKEEEKEEEAERGRRRKRRRMRRGKPKVRGVGVGLVQKKKKWKLEDYNKDTLYIICIIKKN